MMYENTFVQISCYEADILAINPHFRFQKLIHLSGNPANEGE